ncbi:MAG TPA: hypothetical protein VKH41_14905 [Myxococcota bacterium]|nr:hypothetical protein [Myxococcota bacterium]
MKSSVYGRWDGTQDEFRLDAERALDALSNLMMEGLDAREALEWMRQHGFELAGLDMRVMGLSELIEELRDEIRRARADLARRFEELLDREQARLRENHGFESARMNEFKERRHAEASDLGEAIEKFSDYRFEDEEAARAYRELRLALERMRAMEQLARDLAEGNLREISAEQLRDLLGDDAVRSLIWIRDLESTLERAGYLRGGDPQLTPRAIRRIGAQALAEVYAALRRDRPGGHDSDTRGAALPRPDEVKPFEFGDPLDLDVVRTLIDAVKRNARSAPGRPVPLPLPLAVADFALRERDYTTQTTTVLLLDMSWSMSWAGRFPAAKRVALALDHLVRTRFPRDHFFVVGFSTRARELRPTELPEVSWDMGDPFTNLQEGLMIAERLFARHPSASPQVIVVTDGQPTAYYAGRELHVEWPTGFGGVSPHAVAETMKQVRRITRQGVTINTFMLDDAPELVGFVERMTQVNRGRAFFTSPEALGSFLMVDYLRGSRKRRR